MRMPPSSACFKCELQMQIWLQNSPISKVRMESTNTESPAVNRVVHSRNRSGCITCRKRRIKCDEAKPSCNKCTSTGRSCGGYGIWGGGCGRRANISLKPDRRYMPHGQVPFNMSLLPSGSSPLQRRALDHFQRYMRIKLPGVFESSFWGKLILQASFQEPAVLHSVIALSAAQLGDDNVSLRAYNQAIQDLRAHMVGDTPYVLRVTLISCMVFICLEQLRGSRKLADLHLRSGFQLLQELQTRQRGQSCNTSPPESVDNAIIEAFTRLNIQCAHFGQSSSYLYKLGQEIYYGRLALSTPQKFNSLQEARQMLDWLMNTTLSLSSHAEELAGRHCSIPRSLRNKVKQLQGALRQWQAGLESSTVMMTSNGSLRDLLGAPMLSLYHHMTTIIAATCLRSGDEMTFDKYTAKFKSLIVDVKKLWDTAKAELQMTPPGKLSFTTDLGLIPPLYYTALKCRDPQLRRTAIDLLRNVPHIEANWDGVSAACVSKKVMELEEQDLYDGYNFVTYIESAPDFIDCTNQAILPIVPRSRRINTVAVALTSDGREKVTITVKQYFQDNNNRSWRSNTIDVVIADK
ncbi:hypothetical protein F5884DRAFT_833042 [Xylogone sp. PMI_703]|nr:hypothetical protein F5884DRAFT_833042 [Xylogone sp. PMI_703]